MDRRSLREGLATLFITPFRTGGIWSPHNILHQLPVVLAMHDPYEHSPVCIAITKSLGYRLQIY